MNLTYKRATIQDIDMLTKTRTEVLRAATVSYTHLRARAQRLILPLQAKKTSLRYTPPDRTLFSVQPIW